MSLGGDDKQMTPLISLQRLLRRTFVEALVSSSGMRSYGFETLSFDVF